MVNKGFRGGYLPTPVPNPLKFDDVASINRISQEPIGI
jgi:hypothetical protein